MTFVMLAQAFREQFGDAPLDGAVADAKRRHCAG
jgi:hypothetical protein